MHHLEVKRQMGAGDIEAVAEMLELAEAADGHRPLGEHKWLDLLEGGRRGFAGFVAWEPGHDHPVGYAQVSRTGSSWALEFVVDPHHRDAGCHIERDLVSSAMAVIAGEGGGRVSLWVPKPTANHDRVAAEAGFTAGRDLLQLRRPLPVDVVAGIDTRPFVVGADEERWLALNNRVFATHPEQGGWDLDELRLRQKESWFDPAGFLLHERGGRLVGFCWTKVHADLDPPLGEIYVIGVDPGERGRGLGRALTLAGLASLSRRGISEAMLYVDAANVAARALYERLGFGVDHLDRAYVADVPAAGRGC